MRTPSHPADSTNHHVPARLLREHEDCRKKDAARMLARRGDQPANCCTYLKVTILRIAAASVIGSTLDRPKTFAFDLHAALRIANDLPPRKGGPARAGKSANGVWEPDTVETWLKGSKNRVPDEYLPRFLTAATTIVDAYFQKLGRNGIPLAQAIEALDNIGHCFSLVFGTLIPPNDGAYKPYKLHVPFIGASFEGAPSAIDPAPLRQLADHAYTSIVNVSGTRMVIVKGSPHSGKKTLLRFFLQRLNNNYLELSDGSRLPVLALALDDQSISDLLDSVYRFYAAARGPHPDQPRLLDGADPQVKLDRIAELAAEYPACVIIADVAPVDADPIVRALLQDHVGDVLFAIMRGNDRTRLIVTAPEQSEALEQVTARLARRPTIIEVDSYITIRQEWLTQQNVTGLLPFGNGDRVRALTCTLAVIAMKLLPERITGRRALKQQRRWLQISIQSDLPEQIVRQLWEDLLRPAERTILGLISASHDGLRLTTLRRLIAALRAYLPESWPDGAPDEDSVIETIKFLGQLIRETETTVERALRGPNAIREKLFTVDDGWRRHLVQAWFEHTPSLARVAHWLIAREAAAQSRAIRISALEGSTSSGFRRDVQALFALVSSVDPSTVRDYRELTTPLSMSQEAAVLPPLDEHASPIPEPTLALRYAYLQLYKADLQGDAFRFQALLDDAALRLSVLLPFFEPETPWTRNDRRRLQRSLRPYGHLLRSFAPSEIVDLLSSVALAAMRIRRFDLVCAAARLCEAVAKLPGVGLAPHVLILPLRAEIDAGILSGGNPDAFPAEQGGVARLTERPASRLASGVQLSDVAKRIEKLLEEVFPLPERGSVPDALLEARGKLNARLGEVLHVSGSMALADAAFKAAAAADNALARDATRLGPVLGGRGARSYLRFLLHRARAPTRAPPTACYTFKSDGLVVPLPPLVDPSHADYLEARRLFNLNSRRLSRGRAADRIGARIDAARLAALGHDFDMALTHLDAATFSRFSAGTSIEALLELLAVRARMKIDAAVLCCIAAEMPAQHTARSKLTGLLAYLNRTSSGSHIDPDHPDDAVRPAAEALVKRATVTSEAFYRYAHSWGIHHPYFTFGTFLMGWCKVIDSRLASTPDTRLRLLSEGLEHVDRARRHMYEGEYEMHFCEVGRLSRALRKVLPPRPKPQ